MEVMIIRLGQVNCNTLNIRKSPSTSAPRWNGPWPKNRIALITSYSPGWYQTLYRGEPAFVSAPLLTLLDTPVPDSIPDRMINYGRTGSWPNEFSLLQWLYRSLVSSLRGLARHACRNAPGHDPEYFKLRQRHDLVCKRSP